MTSFLFFCIPVAPRQDDDQWAEVDALLRQTLTSTLRQTRPECRTIICGHDRPPCLDDPAFRKVRFLQAQFERPDGQGKSPRRDKVRKRWQIATWVRRRGGGYFMYLDADDLVHRELADHVLGTADPAGYRVTSGYMLDVSSGRIAPVPGAVETPFDRISGSSGIVYFRPEDLPRKPYPAAADKELYYFRVRNHLAFADLRAPGGGSLSPIPFPAVLYAVNGGQHLSHRFQRTLDRRTEIADRVAAAAISDDAAIRAAFGLPPG